MKKIPSILFLLFPLLLHAQYGKDFTLMNNRVIVNHSESTVYAFVLHDKPGRKTHHDYFYYWFASNDIKHTRGAYEGKLLHGQYTEFYLNKNLKEKGKVRYGLRQGTWKSWYPNGEYKEFVHYRNSERTRHTSFYENGALMSKGTYKNNKLHGTIKNYTPDGKEEKVRYKNGEVYVKAKKEKKVRVKKNQKDSLQVKDTASVKKRLWWKGKQKKEKVTLPAEQQQPVPAMPRDLPQPGNEKKPTKQRKKSKTEDVKVRKFLWIIPMQPAPPKEKQT